MGLYLYLLHIFIFSVFLSYIGIMQDKMPKWMYPVILVVGLIVILYHIFKNESWINYIHILVIGPLLVYIGWFQKNSDKRAFLVAIMLAGATFAYHLYRLLIKTGYLKNNGL